jgi:hypothetical protein
MKRYRKAILGIAVLALVAVVLIVILGGNRKAVDFKFLGDHKPIEITLTSGGRGYTYCIPCKYDAFLKSAEAELTELSFHNSSWEGMEPERTWMKPDQLVLIEDHEIHSEGGIFKNGTVRESGPR